MKGRFIGMRVHVAWFGLFVLMAAGCGSKSKEQVTAPTKPGLQKLETKDSKVGTGAAVAEGDHVWVRYTGKLADGSVFDSNAEQSKPPFHVQVGAGGVIKGWDQGLVGIKLGGKRNLSVPFALGYGPAGSGKIPPMSDLFFELEVIHMIKADEINDITVKIIKEGSGRAAKVGDTVTIDYDGKNIDGEEIDSSKTQGKPAVFTIGKQELLANGLEDGIVGMKIGEKRSITLPPGMGQPTSRPTIQIFEVTLKSIK